jgi:A/G-specific adenine glycosylase
MKHPDFTTPLLAWFDLFGRKDLPWQHPRSPYYVWISEIMLQQTQVKTVIPYFLRFIEHFPTISSVANASLDEVLALWSGLGYYSRGRNIHRAAQQVMSVFSGELPDELTSLISLPGIGQTTAAAIISQAFNRPAAILDGNVKRVLSRYFFIEGDLTSRHNQQQLWQLAEDCLPTEQAANYTQAIMDLGATCCTSRRPECSRCPLISTCQAFQSARVNEVPYKKQRKALPVKTADFLILHQDNKILLKKRPPSGIWGGLWCLPELISLKSPLPQRPSSFHHLKHTFTHFHLMMTIYSIPFDLNLLDLNDEYQWIEENTHHTIGLPKPIKQMIEKFYLV